MELKTIEKGRSPVFQVLIETCNW